MRPTMQNQNVNNDLVIDDDGEIVNQDYQNNSNENEQLDSQQENLNEIEDDEEEDDRLTYTLITLDLGNLIHIFEENNIFCWLNSVSFFQIYNCNHFDPLILLTLI